MNIKDIYEKRYAFLEGIVDHLEEVSLFCMQRTEDLSHERAALKSILMKQYGLNEESMSWLLTKESKEEIASVIRDINHLVTAVITSEFIEETPELKEVKNTIRKTDVIRRVVTKDDVQVVLEHPKKRNGQTDLKKIAGLIAEYLAKNGKTSREELITISGLSTSSLSNLLALYGKEYKIHRINSGRRGHYRLG